MLKTDKITGFCIHLLGTGLLLLLPLFTFGQRTENQLNKARIFYRNGQYDSSRIIYQKIYQNEPPNAKLDAMIGLIRLALVQSNIEKADSLINLGEELVQLPEIQLATSCAFGLIKGEYFSKNSQFIKALREHKKIIKKSQQLKEDRLPYAEALYYTALNYERLGIYDSSVYFVSRAYKVYKTLMDTTDVRFSAIYNGMGACYYRSNRLEEAKKYYLLSKSIAEKNQGTVSLDMANCLINLSGIYRSEEAYEEAIKATEQALKIFNFLKDENGVAMAYYGLGVYHYFQGDYGKTKAYMEACIGIRERLYHKNHYSLIGPYEVLGITYEEAGNYENNLMILKKVREKIIANYGPNSLSEGYNCENRAVSLKMIGQMDSALKYIKIAHKIFSQHLDPNDITLAVNNYNYGNILSHLQSFEKAQQVIKRSMRIYETQGWKNSSENARNIILLALIEGKKGNWQKADKQFTEALQLIREDASSEYSYQQTLEAMNILNEYTAYLFRKYQNTRSDSVLDEFQIYSKLFLRHSDRLRLRFNDPYTRSILAKKNADNYQRNIGAYTLLYRKSREWTYLNDAYLFSEHGKTSMLRDLQNEKIKSFSGLPDSLLSKERKLKKEITELNEVLLNEPNSLTIQQSLLKAKANLEAHIQQMSVQYPRYHQLRFASRIPPLDTIRNHLSDEQTLIQYMQDDTAYYALLINQKEVLLEYLGKKEHINKALQNWRNAIINQQQEVPAKVLSQFIWEPLEEHLHGNRVIIVPVGQLFYLNFELLYQKNRERYVIEDYTISYTFSFTLFFSKEVQSDQGKLLAIAPGFEETLKQEYLSNLDTLEIPDHAYLQTIRQPWSIRYARELKRRFVGNIHTMIGLQATESEVKANLPLGRIIYVGTHAIADAEDPLQSRLILAKETGEKKEDGYLHAYELYGLPLKAGLMILSACESGLGKLEQGEGMISLAYSIHYAGCPSTVMSLWKVDEKANTEICRYFFDNLGKGMTKSDALREAKLTYLKEGTQKHPFFWGGMILMGQDGKVLIPGKSDIPAVMVTFLCIVVFLLITIWVQKIRNRSKIDL